MNVIKFLEEFKKSIRKSRNRSISCKYKKNKRKMPKCNKKLEISNEDIHIFHCPFCKITLNRDEIAS